MNLLVVVGLTALVLIGLLVYKEYQYRRRMEYLRRVAPKEPEDLEIYRKKVNERRLTIIQEEESRINDLKQSRHNVEIPFCFQMRTEKGWEYLHGSWCFKPNIREAVLDFKQETEINPEYKDRLIRVVDAYGHIVWPAANLGNKAREYDHEEAIPTYFVELMSFWFHSSFGNDERLDIRQNWDIWHVTQDLQEAERILEEGSKYADLMRIREVGKILKVKEFREKYTGE